MKLSIVIAVLDSHEIVRRQYLYLRSLNLPETVEVIFVDDGSQPPLEDYSAVSRRQFRTLQTNDTRRWTQGLARMLGISRAQGEYIFCTDIDHIISREAIDFALSFTGDKAVFRRRFAYLNEAGDLVRDRGRVLAWGLLPSAIRDADLSDGVHGNTWLMRKSVFWELGGYDRTRCESGTHLQGEDRDFNRRWARASRAGKYQEQVEGPPIYVFPMGRYHVTGDENPHGLFHNMEKEKWE